MAVFNPFQLVGDVVHFSGKILLLYKTLTSKECTGISLRTQLLYLCVFLTRYIDLLTVFVSWYNSLMKALYLVLTLVACCALQIKQRNLPQQSLDTFPLWVLVVPSFLLSLVPVYFYFDVVSVPAITEFFWYFSITLEALAMIPQYLLLLALGSVDHTTLVLVVCQGGYRAFYCLFWLINYLSPSIPTFRSPYLWVCGTVQTLLFVCYMGWWASKPHASQPAYTLAAKTTDPDNDPPSTQTQSAV